MFCRHKDKMLVKSFSNGRSMVVESNYVFTKITKVFFCPSCNRNVTKHYLK